MNKSPSHHKSKQGITYLKIELQVARKASLPTRKIKLEATGKLVFPQKPI